MSIALFVTFQLAGRGASDWVRTQEYATELARYDAVTDMLVNCRLRGGDSLAMISYTLPECASSGVGDYQRWRCTIETAAFCQRVGA